MSLNTHVYQIYIAASPEQVWAAITESEWTRRYFHTTSFIEPPAAGQGLPYGPSRWSAGDRRRHRGNATSPSGESGSIRADLAHPVRRSVGARTTGPRGVDRRERRRRPHSCQACARRPRSEPTDVAERQRRLGLDSGQHEDSVGNGKSATTGSGLRGCCRSGEILTAAAFLAAPIAAQSPLVGA